MSVRRFRNSLGDAWHGLAVVFHTEQNFRFQLVGGVVVFALCWYFHVPTWQVIVLLLLVALILVLELINTAVEYFTDLIKPRLHTHAGTIKDIMAGAVLVTSLTALIIGILIFAPYFIVLLK